MNDLLRMANELVEAREKAPIGPWKNNEYTTDAGDGRSIFYDDERLNNSSEFIVIAGNHAVDVIKGYQDLVRRMIVHLEASDLYVENNIELSDANDLIILEAIASIPEERTHG